MTRSARERVLLRRRVQHTGVGLVALGVVVYAFMAYRVLQAGGFTTTSLRGACAEAATGRASATYRLSEDVVVDRTFLPLTATCRWSGGTGAELVRAAWWGWTGPALVVLGLLVVLVLRVTARRAA